MKIFCKICGITRQEDLDKAHKLGANMCGFIFHAKSPRAMSIQKTACLESGNMLRVGVFVEQNSEQIKSIMREAKLDFAQLHGKQSIACAQEIGVNNVIRVLWPEKYDTVQDFEKDIEKYNNSCAYFLFDAGKSGGGSGQSIDLNMLTPLRNIKKPWILAGGIGVQNLAPLLSECKHFAIPNGIDCNSALESEAGIKDHTKMEELFNILNGY